MFQNEIRVIFHREKIFKPGTLCKESPHLRTGHIFMILQASKSDDHYYTVLIVCPGNKLSSIRESGEILDRWNIFTTTEILLEP